MSKLVPEHRLLEYRRWITGCITEPTTSQQMATIDTALDRHRIERELRELCDGSEFIDRSEVLRILESK